MLDALGPTLGAPKIWQATSDSDPVGRLAEIFAQTSGAYKWIHYLPVYQSLIDASTPIRLLEIGVFRGGSLRMWREYLHPDSLVVGIDIDPACQVFDDPTGNVHVRIGSQEDPEFLHQVAAEFGPFDVIIDDGSHRATHMVQSFLQLFDSAVAEGGVYIVEDLHASYVTEYRDNKMSFVDFVGVLIDAMHSHYQVGWPQSVRSADDRTSLSVSVPAITPILGSIEVFDSIVAVKKTTRPLPRVVLR